MKLEFMILLYHEVKIMQHFFIKNLNKILFIKKK